MTIAEVKVPEPLALTRRHKVVLVDDDPAVLGSLRRLLRREPYDLLCTDRPEMALAWIEQGGVSLAVLDQRMPGLCGTDLAERIRRCSPGTIRVMLTAYPGNTIVQHGLAGDVQWLISKPWNDDALRLALRHLLKEEESKPGPPDPAGTRPSPESPRIRTDPPGANLVSWSAAGTIRLIFRRLAAGLGWALGLLGTTDAGGVGSH